MFAEHYLKRNLPMLAPERRRAMIDIRDELMRRPESMSERVRAGALAFDVEIDDFVEGVEEEIDGGACRVGLLDREGGPPHSGAGAAEPSSDTEHRSEWSDDHTTCRGRQLRCALFWMSAESDLQPPPDEGPNRQARRRPWLASYSERGTMNAMTTRPVVLHAGRSVRIGTEHPRGRGAGNPA